MANVYCVTYDLRDDPEEYTGLYNVLTSCRHWWHFLESTWLVVTDDSARELWKKVEPQLRSRDFILIIAVGPEFKGSLPKDAWEWIREHVGSAALQPQ